MPDSAMSSAKSSAEASSPASSTTGVAKIAASVLLCDFIDFKISRTSGAEMRLSLYECRHESIIDL